MTDIAMNTAPGRDALCNGIRNFVFVGMTEELICRGTIQGYPDALWRQRSLGISAGVRETGFRQVQICVEEIAS